VRRLANLVDYAAHCRGARSLVVTCRVSRVTGPVGGKRPNGFGLYDMHDNVAERSQDWYATFAKPGLRSDPEGPGMGRERVIRGGDWLVGHEVHRCASRLPEDPSNAG